MYTLYVSMASPYSMKVAALIGYAGLPCELAKQNLVSRFGVIKRLTGKTMVPVLRDGDWAISDSTHIARYVMAKSERPTLPRSARLGPLCWLLEEFADEWISRWMIYSRWSHLQDTEEVESIVGRELAGNMPILSSILGKQAGSMVRKKLKSAGIRPENDAALQNSRDRCLQVLDALAGTPPLYLFEGYPTVADFAIYGALGQFARDRTGRKTLRTLPDLRRYIERIDAMTIPLPLIETMDQPSRDISRLQPLFAEFIGTYWPVLVANYRALAQAKPPSVVRAVLIDGATFSFAPSRYVAGRFKEILAVLDETYRRQDHLFGDDGLRLESALMSNVARLTHYVEGRELLREYQHLGMH
ncbi:MAG: glutathione S-transferase family protein [Bradymonadaceae bacterium]